MNYTNVIKCVLKRVYVAAFIIVLVGEASHGVHKCFSNDNDQFGEKMKCLLFLLT